MYYDSGFPQKVGGFSIFLKSILTNVDILVIIIIATSVDILFCKGEILCRL